jgi:DNA-binding response OmpR family regulator
MARALKPESHIVVVDSRPRDYHDLASMAGEWQWHVHFLTTARAAITFLRRARADLWMINTWLPDMSGFTLYETLRDQVAGASAMIVSDRYDPEDERLACRGGAILYVCKGPADSIDCRSLLQSLTTGDRNESAAQPTCELLNSIARPVADPAPDPHDNAPCPK